MGEGQQPLSACPLTILAIEATPSRVVIKNMKWLLFVAALVCTSLSALAHFHRNAPTAPEHLPTERFDPALGNIQRLSDAVDAVRSHLPSNASTQRQVAHAVEQFLRDRFYHGYSHFSFSDNWPAYFAGFVWSDLSAKVEPEDILSHPWAGCSQQAIVFQAILARFGIEYASIRIRNPANLESVPKHFATVAKLDGRWYFVDSWDQLRRTRLGPVELDRLLLPNGAGEFKGSFGARYAAALHSRHFSISDHNRFPAPRARLFGEITLWFSYWSWLILVCLFALCWFAERPRSLLQWSAARSTC